MTLQHCDSQQVVTAKSGPGTVTVDAPNPGPGNIEVTGPGGSPVHAIVPVPTGAPVGVPVPDVSQVWVHYKKDPGGTDTVDVDVTVS